MPEHDLTKNLVAYYPLSGDFKDESGQMNHGEVHRKLQPVHDIYGIKDKAYYFNGKNNYILMKHSASLSVQKSISLVAWVQVSKQTLEDKLASANLDNRYMFVVAKHWSQTTRSYDLSFFSDKSLGHHLVFQIFDEDDNRYRVAYSIGDAIDEGWHLIVSTYDESSGEASIYLDRKKVLTQKIGKDITIQQPKREIPASIGCYLHLKNPHGEPARSFFQGSIAGVRIYARALSAEEIEAFPIPLINLYGMRIGNLGAQILVEALKGHRELVEKHKKRIDELGLTTFFNTIL